MRQRDVPAPPEVGDALGAVGRVEVLQELEAEHAAQPDGHVRVAGEVEVDLEGVGQHAEPGVQRPRAVGAEGGVGDLAHGLASRIFLAKPSDEQRHARTRTARSVCVAADELVGHRVVADDRPGDQVREQRDEAGEIDEATGRAAPSPR